MIELLTNPTFIVAVIGFVTALLGIYKVDPDRKYQKCVYKILEGVKEVVPENVNEVIEMIQKAMQDAGLNPDSNLAKKAIDQVKENVKV